MLVDSEREVLRIEDEVLGLIVVKLLAVLAVLKEKLLVIPQGNASVVVSPLPVMTEDVEQFEVEIDVLELETLKVEEEEMFLPTSKYPPATTPITITTKTPTVATKEIANDDLDTRDIFLNGLLSPVFLSMSGNKVPQVSHHISKISRNFLTREFDPLS